jgi:hypothetical protein
MGATLKRRSERFRWKRDSWQDVLRLAREFGWQAAGTVPPRGVRKADWGAADYLTCSRQQVTSDDALAMAAALSRALQRIPTARNAPPPKDASPELKQFSGLHRDGLADFASFCRRGAFRITDDVYDD